MARKTKDPGFGYNSKENARNIINDNGTSNVRHINRKRNVNDLYTYFIDISWFPHLPSQAGIGPSHVWLCGRPALPCPACSASLVTSTCGLPSLLVALGFEKYCNWEIAEKICVIYSFLAPCWNAPLIR